MRQWGAGHMRPVIDAFSDVFALSRGWNMRRLMTCLAAVVVLAAMATPARAAFHLFRIAEFFSSADGSVQFIRMHEAFGSGFQNIVGERYK